MRGAGVATFAVWGWIIANTDQHSRVEINPEIVAFLLGCSAGEVSTVVESLCAPDPKSRCGEHDGRRLVKEGEYQYFVPTHSHYRSIRTTEEKREYNRAKQRESRVRRGLSKMSNLSNNVNGTTPKTGGEDEEGNDTVKQDRTDKTLNQGELLNVKPSVKNVKPVKTTEAEAQAEAQAGAPATRESGTGKPVPPPKVGKKLMEAWNECEKLTKIKAITTGRERALRARAKDQFFVENWREGIKRASESDFCTGKNKHGWVATFDWFIRPDTLGKLMEGQYDNRSGTDEKSEGSRDKRNTGLAPITPKMI